MSLARDEFYGTAGTPYEAWPDVPCQIRVPVGTVEGDMYACATDVSQIKPILADFAPAKSLAPPDPLLLWLADQSVGVLPGDLPAAGVALGTSSPAAEPPKQTPVSQPNSAQPSAKNADPGAAASAGLGWILAAVLILALVCLRKRRR